MGDRKILFGPQGQNFSDGPPTGGVVCQAFIISVGQWSFKLRDSEPGLASWRCKPAKTFLYLPSRSLQG